MSYTCNGAVFLYEEGVGSLYAVMVLEVILCGYMIVRMVRLCSSAFSYSNFHIHETYKFYAIALIALAFTIFYHKLQVDLIQVRENSYPEVIRGYQLLIEVVGIVSTFFSRLLFSLNGILWMLVSLGCDYTHEAELTLSRIMGSEFRDTNTTRKRLQNGKKILLYLIFPLLIGLTLTGTLSQQDAWCDTAEVCFLLSGIISLICFVGGISIFLRRRWRDPTVSWKVLLAKSDKGKFDIPAFVGRCALSLLAGDADQSASYLLAGVLCWLGRFIVVCYNIFFILVPFLALSILSERQLEREKCSLLKSSEVMLFRSTIT